MEVSLGKVSMNPGFSIAMFDLRSNSKDNPIDEYLEKSSAAGMGTFRAFEIQISPIFCSTLDTSMSLRIDSDRPYCLSWTKALAISQGLLTAHSKIRTKTLLETYYGHQRWKIALKPQQGKIQKLFSGL